ncbi:MAG: DUF3990 domain-containing protein [Lachnospiraceae bacterium]|nr:DUF3990 domain-containing protein [Lachnospiraceae bacterium]
MKKVLYHGSEHIIEKPQFGKGALTNDYGRGFYCTENMELAMEWACAKNTNGYANQYELDMTGLSVLNLNSEKYNILNWLALLAAHRTYWEKSSISEQAKKYLKDNFLPDIQRYDIIIGYRADDSYFSFAQDFVANAVSLRQLDKAMHLGRLGEQVVLKSREAFERIQFIDSIPAQKEEYFAKKTLRDKEARRDYRRSREQSADVNDIYMLDIMREGITNGDQRLR